MNPAKADRDLTRLIPDMRSRVEKFLKECKDAGKEVFVTEAYRTKARQTYLYAFGRFGENKTSAPVTWTMESNHMKGLAVDIAFQKPGDIYVGPWEDVFDIAEANGLKSLYRQHGVDKPHLEFDYEWRPPVNRRKDENYLIDEKIITKKKDIDGSSNREELYAIVANNRKSLSRKMNAMAKNIRDLEKKLKELS